ncbi:MAG TPA: hypothetical protein VLS90_19695, partial [Thermodesulfobacteriota bacterium]|nr:hypothetical protein [Thermodesulfobacteriota bacterium]
MSANIFFPGTASAERNGRKICDFSVERARGGRKKYPEQQKAPFFNILLNRGGNPVNIFRSPKHRYPLWREYSR